MIPLMLKDLFEHWKSCFGMLAASLAAATLAVLRFPPDHPMDSTIEGFLSGITLAAGMIFTYQVVHSERKRRHLILLRTLPVTDRTLTWAKFGAAFTLSAAVLAGSRLPGIVVGRFGPWEGLLGYAFAMALYVAFTLLLTLFFRGAVGAMIPLYTAAAFFLLAREPLAAHRELLDQVAFLLIPGAGAALLGAVELAAWQLGRKELDF